MPTFPNARYVFSESEPEAWDPDRDPKFPRTQLEDSMLPVVEAGRIVRSGDAFRMELDDGHW